MQKNAIFLACRGFLCFATLTYSCVKTGQSGAMPFRAAGRERSRHSSAMPEHGHSIAVFSDLGLVKIDATSVTVIYDT